MQNGESLFHLDGIYKMVLEETHRLHFSRNQNELQFNLPNVWKKWSEYQDLSNFLNYFWTNKWQIFYTPPGYATTNNPTESSQNK